MRLHRRILLIVSVVLVGGSLSWTAGYGFHLRSDTYRREMEAGLSEFFDLPCEIGLIRGRTFSSRAFNDVAIWLPGRRDRVFRCREAVWQEHATDRDETNELDLFDGVLVLGSDRWVKEDYRQVLESGLGHDFEDLNLSRVGMEGFEVSFDRANYSLRCRETSGTVDLSNPKDGIARLHAFELNGHRINQGVQIYARFLPKSGVRVSELILTLPPVPLATIGLDTVLGGPVTTGGFEGRVQYLDSASEAGSGPELWIRGRLQDGDLLELTRGVPLGPYEGRFSVEVEAARFADSVVTHFRGGGRLSNLTLSNFAPLVGAADLAGSASFDFDVVDLAMGHVARLRFSGELGGMSLREWLQPWGKGAATGQLSIRVNNVNVVNDNIKSADIEITVLPPAGQPGTIDRELLLSVAEKALNFTWPTALPKRLLPEQVEYAEFGMRLLVRDNQLRILGTHGRQGDTILTIRVGGVPFGVVHEQSGTIDLSAAMTTILERARSYDAQGVHDWWSSRSEAGPATRPAQD